MSKIATALKLLIHNRGDFFAYVLMFFNFLFPDKLYLSLMYRCKMGYWMNWEDPKSFTEKLQWLKLYDRKPEYTTMVDKCLVKEYVAELIGEQYIIQTLGVWDKAEDIDWHRLPDKFVLKTTHGGGGSGVVICRDKSILNRNKAISKLNQSMNKCIYRSLREWPYKDVRKRIIAEEYIEDPNDINSTSSLLDYKFYCFNGEPQIVMVSVGRYSGSLCFDYYNMQWEKLPIVWDKPNSNINHPCPSCFEEILCLCRKLAKDIPHVRCDFYIIDNKPLFGELTFYDGSGYARSVDPIFNENLGAMLKLPVKNE